MGRKNGTNFSRQKLYGSGFDLGVYGGVMDNYLASDRDSQLAAFANKVTNDGLREARYH